MKSSGQLSWEEEKRQKAERRRLEKDVERLEQQIDETEKQKKELEDKMARPEVYCSGDKCRVIQNRIAELEKQLADLNREWEAAAEKIQ